MDNETFALLFICGIILFFIGLVVWFWAWVFALALALIGAMPWQGWVALFSALAVVSVVRAWRRNEA